MNRTGDKIFAWARRIRWFITTRLRLLALPIAVFCSWMYAASGVSMILLTCIALRQGWWWLTVPPANASFIPASLIARTMVRLGIETAIGYYGFSILRAVLHACTALVLTGVIRNDVSASDLHWRSLYRLLNVKKDSMDHRRMAGLSIHERLTIVTIMHGICRTDVPSSERARISNELNDLTKRCVASKDWGSGVCIDVLERIEQIYFSRHNSATPFRARLRFDVTSIPAGLDEQTGVRIVAGDATTAEQRNRS